MTMTENDDRGFKRDLLASLPNLRAFAVSLTGRHDKADDLVQDTIMKAWANQTSFTAGTNMRAWLFTILRNEFYSQMRKRGREVQDTDGLFSERFSVHPEQYGRLDLQDFRKALDKLPDDQREAIILVGAAGLPTRKRRRSAAAQSAPSRAASAARARAFRSFSEFREKATTARMPAMPPSRRGRSEARYPAPGASPPS